MSQGMDNKFLKLQKHALPFEKRKPQLKKKDPRKYHHFSSTFQVQGRENLSQIAQKNERSSLKKGPDFKTLYY